MQMICIFKILQVNGTTSCLDINMDNNLFLFVRVYSINLRRLSIRGILDGKCKNKTIILRRLQ